MRNHRANTLMDFLIGALVLTPATIAVLAYIRRCLIRRSERADTNNWR